MRHSIFPVLASLAMSFPCQGQVTPPGSLLGGTDINDVASNGFDIGFEDLLSIVLTQLTYQDPLKPIDNFEFVSQLAQFSQIQQTQTMTRQLESIERSQDVSQAMSLLGLEVDVPAGNIIITGRVIAITFDQGQPRLTIETEDERTISDISIAGVSQARRQVE